MKFISTLVLHLQNIEWHSLLEVRLRRTCSYSTCKALLPFCYAAPMVMDNGRDLAEMLCMSYESDACDDDPNEHYDFSALLSFNF